MPLDVGRVTHLLEQMHRSEDNAGDPIAVSKVLVTDGARGFTWEDYAATGNAILRFGGAAEWFLDHGNTGTTETIDLDDGNAHWITLDNNCTLTFTGAVADIGGQDVSSSFTLFVEQDGVGSRTITWPGSVVWLGGSAPTLSTGAADVDVISFLTPDGGTTWFGFAGGGSGSPTGTAGGDLSGTYPNPSVVDDSHSHTSATAPGGGAPPPILLASDHATPFDFGDILQNSEGTDFLWASE